MHRTNLLTTYATPLANCWFSEFPWLQGYWEVLGRQLEMENCQKDNSMLHLGHMPWGAADHWVAGCIADFYKEKQWGFKEYHFLGKIQISFGFHNTVKNCTCISTRKHPCRNAWLGISTNLLQCNLIPFEQVPWWQSTTSNSRSNTTHRK